ncbi:DUF2525 domain-containing protein [Mixta intestinalis]|uniref:Uncharacterized protein n=1 Tax=Mixta intestinalis TaxID=1615494 RepID=A0A6P1PY29_9GAMM|nr:DUF2525 domain-containing protein [Mixta intestinalis]QHM71496.1 hypothetical protein C7M51_01783 [Mixta intestinalis]
MNDYLFPGNAAMPTPSSSDHTEAFSKMDSYSEWEQEQHARLLNAVSPELAQRFELDIRDCWISEIK